MGVERFLMEIEAQEVPCEKPDYVKIYFASMSDDAKKFIAKTCYDLRLNGVGCEQDLMGRAFRAQMKYAGKAQSSVTTSSPPARSRSRRWMTAPRQRLPSLISLNIVRTIFDKKEGKYKCLNQ